MAYTDPTGEYALIDDLIVMAVGGVINLGVNAIQGNINSWGEGFGYFASGAAAAEVTIYAGPVAGGTVLGVGNDLTNQISNNEIQNINFNQTFFAGFMGGATAYVGGQFTGFVSPQISGGMSNITNSPIIQNAITEGLSNASSGFILGTGVSLLNGNDLHTALGDGGQGALLGGGLGLITGTVTVTGYDYAKSNKIDPWTGVAKSSRIVNTSVKQLQAKFKHAGDFGVKDNWNKAASGKFNSTINQHINSSGVKVINGTYHGQPAIHYLNPNSGLNVITRPNGQFWSRWKLNSGQLQNVLQHGGL